MSDTVSVNSSQSGGGDSAHAGIVVEEVGKLALTDFVPKRLALHNYTLAALSEDDRLILGEIRTRGGDDWTLAGRSVTSLGGKANEDRRYVDLAIVPNAQHGQGGSSIIFLVEKKNKERYLAAHNVRHGKTLALNEEFSAYDKVNVLGKGVTHIAADASAPEPTVYSVSNLLRKLRLEDAGSTLKPTPARATVPPEGQDGTLSVTVQPCNVGKNAHQATVVVAFRTKSASKNKFMIEWYQAKRDELTCLKSAIKFGEECEPVVLLSDPKDTRTVFALCRNRTAGNTALYKITRGRRNEEPIAVFNYVVELAAMGMSADQTILLTFEPDREVARIYTMSKSEGFRGRHPICAHCPLLQQLASPAHVISCATHRWQLPMSLVDQILGLKVPIGNNCAQLQVALVTLLDGNSGRYVVEPESGLPYRLRILGCDIQGFTPLSILLEDLERTFEGADDERLSSATIKVCINTPPCRDSLSQLSAWLMGGRVGSIEVYYVKGPTASAGIQVESTERLVLKPISGDRFRSYITDMDWTQMNQRQGTFTLNEEAGAPSSAMSASTPSAALGGGGGGRTKIPVVSSRGQSASPAGARLSMNGGGGGGIAASPANSGSSSLEPEVAAPHSAEPESAAHLRSMVESLTGRLRAAQADNDALRANLEALETGMENVTNFLNHSS